jgi:hypothetical protein
MAPLIASGDEVVVRRVVAERLEEGDIVLCKVAGSYYVHLVKSVDRPRCRVQIGNNRGRINGWTGFDKVYGIVTVVAGRAVGGATDKVLDVI